MNFYNLKDTSSTIPQIFGILLSIQTVQVWSQSSPLFYGWFFDETVANGLRDITNDYLAKLYADVNEVQAFLLNVSTAAGIENPLRYYTKPVDPNTGNFDPFFHITSYYCGNVDCSSYTNRVAQYVNETFPTHLVGVFFTPRTYGVRVNLTSIQKDIFNMDEEINGRRSLEYRNDEQCDDQLRNGIQFCPQDDTDIHPTDSRGMEGSQLRIKQFKNFKSLVSSRYPWMCTECVSCNHRTGFVGNSRFRDESQRILCDNSDGSR